MKLPNESDVAKARQQFARSLIGRWSTISPITMMMDQIWEFYANGTGKVSTIGPFEALRNEAWFEWRQPEELVIELRMTRQMEHEPGYTPSLDVQWRRIRYDFQLAPSTLIEEVGLYDISEQGLKFLGIHVGSFAGSLAPLAYRGPIT